MFQSFLAYLSVLNHWFCGSTLFKEIKLSVLFSWYLQLYHVRWSVGRVCFGRLVEGSLGADIKFANFNSLWINNVIDFLLYVDHGDATCALSQEDESSSWHILTFVVSAFSEIDVQHMWMPTWSPQWNSRAIERKPIKAGHNFACAYFPDTDSMWVTIFMLMQRFVSESWWPKQLGNMVPSHTTVDTNRLSWI